MTVKRRHDLILILKHLFVDTMGKKNKMKNKNKAKMKWLQRDTSNGGAAHQVSKRKFAFSGTVLGEVFKRPKLVASQNAVSVLKKTQKVADSKTEPEPLIKCETGSNPRANQITRHRNSLPIFAARSRYYQLMRSRPLTRYNTNDKPNAFINSFAKVLG